MCDVKKFFQMYDEIKDLEPEDTLQLVLEAKDKEEKSIKKFRLIITVNGKIVSLSVFTTIDRII